MADEGATETEHKGNEFTDGAPPPDRQQRGLIFDSLSKIVGKGGGKRQGRSKANDHRGTFVATWGAGYHGQLGRTFIRGQKKYTAVPLYLDLDVVVRQVTCGGLHTAIVTEGGDVYTWGDGRKGQLGQSADPSLKQTPRLVDALAGVFVVQIACGGNHTAAITDSGLLYSWGWAKYGQTGHGDRTQWKTPRRVEHENAKEIVAIAAGNKHTACINKKGHAITFGCGEHGQTGLGPNNCGETLVPTKIECLIEQGIKMESLACGSIHTCFVSDQGEVYLCGFGEHFTSDESQHFFYDPKKIEMPEPVRQISCGQSHNIALSTTGNVYTWGSGDMGQLGHGVCGNLSTPRLVLEFKGMEQVAAGRYHSFALSNMGVLYSFGCGENGQLGQNSDENIALPTVVQPILGSVVGQVACGEHHTAVLSSAPWSKLSQDMQEWDLGSKEEQAKKKERLKKTNRGLTSKDLGRIQEDMRKWQEQQDLGKQQKKLQEQEEMERDINSINLGGRMTEEQQAIADKTQTMKLPSVTNNDKGDEEDAEEERKTKVSQTQVRLPKVSQNKSYAQTQSFPGENREGAGEINANAGQRAPLTRTLFLKETAAMVKRMKSVVSDKGESESNRHLNQMMRLVYDFRKEYDQLANDSRTKSKQMESLRRDVESLMRSSDIDKEHNEDAYEKLKDLEMRLNTVTIKIAETSENRRNYELNIAHLNEEDFEHFNQLEALRKQCHDNNNFFKKMNELKGQALEEKERAEAELEEFRVEIGSYQKFVQEQLGQFEQILCIVQKQSENREEQQLVRTDKMQARIKLRIEKLELEAEAADKEAGGLSTRLTSLDLKLRHFEDSFQKITAATGLTNPTAIVNKFFFKEEIKEQLQMEISDKQLQLEELNATRDQLEDNLKEVQGAFKEQKWADVNNVQQQQAVTGSKAAKAQENMDRASSRIAFVQEALLSVFKTIGQAQNIDVGEGFNLDSTSIWTPEQSAEMFAKLLPSMDELLEAEREANVAKEEEKRIQAELSKHNEMALDAFGIAAPGSAEEEVEN